MHSLRLLQVFDTLVTELDAPCVEELEDATIKHHNDKGFVEETSEEKDTFIFFIPLLPSDHNINITWPHIFVFEQVW